MECRWGLLRMTILRTYYTPINLRMMCFSLFYRIATVGAKTQIGSVLLQRKIPAIFIMNFMIAIGLRIVINIISFHTCKIFSGIKSIYCGAENVTENPHAYE